MLGACAASQPYALAGPRSSSVPRRCSELPGGATHLGSGWAANSARLLGVAAEALTTIERDAVARRGRGQAVERERDVRPHRLALPERERAPYSPGPGAAAAVRRAPAAPPRRDDRGAAPLAGDLDDGRVAHRDADARRRERARVGERDLDASAPLSRAHRQRPRSSLREIRVALEVQRVRPSVDRRRREQPVVARAHRARAGERARDPRPAGCVPARPIPRATAAEHERRDEHDAHRSRRARSSA